MGTAFEPGCPLFLAGIRGAGRNYLGNPDQIVRGWARVLSGFAARFAGELLQVAPGLATKPIGDQAKCD